MFRHDRQRGGYRLLATQGIDDLDTIRTLAQVWPEQQGLMGRAGREQRSQELGA